MVAILDLGLDSRDQEIISLGLPGPESRPCADFRAGVALLRRNGARMTSVSETVTASLVVLVSDVVPSSRLSYLFLPVRQLTKSRVFCKSFFL